MKFFPTLTNFSVIPFLPLSLLLECLRQHMCCQNLTINKVTGRRIIRLKKEFHNRDMIRFCLSFLLNEHSFIRQTKSKFCENTGKVKVKTEQIESTAITLNKLSLEITTPLNSS